MAAEVYAPNDPNAKDRNFALSDRVRTALAAGQREPDRSPPSRPNCPARSAPRRQPTRRSPTAVNSAQDLIDGVEKSDDQQVAASLLAIQTRLQASYQTTSMLSKLTLVNFLLDSRRGTDSPGRSRKIAASSRRKRNPSDRTGSKG